MDKYHLSFPLSLVLSSGSTPMMTSLPSLAVPVTAATELVAGSDGLASCVIDPIQTLSSRSWTVLDMQGSIGLPDSVEGENSSSRVVLGQWKEDPKSKRCVLSLGTLRIESEPVGPIKTTIVVLRQKRSRAEESEFQEKRQRMEGAAQRKLVPPSDRQSFLLTAADLPSGDPLPGADPSTSAEPKLEVYEACGLVSRRVLFRGKPLRST